MKSLRCALQQLRASSGEQPTRTGWLNQVEVFVYILKRRLMRCEKLASIDDLDHRRPGPPGNRLHERLQQAVRFALAGRMAADCRTSCESQRLLRAGPPELRGPWGKSLLMYIRTLATRAEKTGPANRGHSSFQRGLTASANRRPTSPSK
jgi:hypothetical protein